MVQVTAAEVEDLAERFSEVSVERRVDNWVQQAVAVTEPEEQAREERGYGVRILEERPDEGEHEERQPADDERAHYDAKGGAGFSLLRQVEPEFLLVGRVRHAAGAVQVVSHDRRLGRRHRRRGRRGRCEDGLLELLQHRALGLVALAGPAGETSYRVTAALQHRSRSLIKFCRYTYITYTTWYDYDLKLALHYIIILRNMKIHVKYSKFNISYIDIYININIKYQICINIYINIFQPFNYFPKRNMNLHKDPRSLTALSWMYLSNRRSLFRGDFRMRSFLRLHDVHDVHDGRLVGMCTIYI